MADDKRTVELEIIANTQKAEQNLNKIANQAKTIGQTDEKYAKIASKHNKETAKFDKKKNDPKQQKKAADNLKATTRQEEKRLKLLEKQNKELQKYYSTQQKIAGSRVAGGGGGTPTGSGGGRGRDRDAAPGGGALAMAGVASAIGGAVVAAAGLAVGAISRQISSGFDAYVEFGKAKIGLAGMGATSPALNDLRRQSAQQFAYTGTETMEQAAQVGRATGQYGAVGTAQAATRGTSLDMGESIGLMQTLTQAGTGFGGKAGRQGFKEFSKAVAMGTNAGMDEARLPEYITGLNKVVQLQAGRQGGDVSMSEYGRVLQAMGQFGGSGLEGARGGAVLQQLNEAIVKPGGGEAGQAMMLQAMGFGTPGGGATYYEALKQQEQGATATNIKSLFGQTEAQYGGGEEQILALREMTGLSITQLEEMRNVVEGMSGDERDDKLKELIENAATPEERAAKELADIGDVQKQSVEFQDRLVDIGLKSYDSMVKLQVAINNLVDEYLPAAIKLLEIIADATNRLSAFTRGDMATAFGAGIGGTTPESVEKARTSLGVGEFDPARIVGGHGLSMEKRKAIQSVIESENKAGRTGLASWYKNIQGASPEDQREQFAAIFGPGGSFHGMMNEKLEEMIRIQGQMAATQDEAVKLANKGRADDTVTDNYVQNF